MAVIEVTYEYAAFNVYLRLNAQHSEQIGFQIQTLGEAMKLVERYQQMDKSLSIKLPSLTKSKLNTYVEIGNVA